MFVLAQDGVESAEAAAGDARAVDGHATTAHAVSSGVTPATSPSGQSGNTAEGLRLPDSVLVRRPSRVSVVVLAPPESLPPGDAWVPACRAPERRLRRGRGMSSVACAACALRNCGSNPSQPADETVGPVPVHSGPPEGSIATNAIPWPVRSADITAEKSFTSDRVSPVPATYVVPPMPKRLEPVQSGAPVISNSREKESAGDAPSGVLDRSLQQLDVSLFGRTRDSGTKSARRRALRVSDSVSRGKFPLPRCAWILRPARQCGRLFPTASSLSQAPTATVTNSESEESLTYNISGPGTFDPTTKRYTLFRAVAHGRAVVRRDTVPSSRRAAELASLRINRSISLCAAASVTISAPSWADAN